MAVDTDNIGIEGRANSKCWVNLNFICTPFIIRPNIMFYLLVCFLYRMFMNQIHATAVAISKENISKHGKLTRKVLVKLKQL